MKITRLETIILEHSLPVDGRRQWNGGSILGWTVAFIRVHTDEGLDGIGECYFGNFVPQMIPPVVEDLARHLVGEDPFRIGFLSKKLSSITRFWNRQGFGQSVIGAVDIALHDLAGKALGVPVYQLLGGLSHAEIPTYASAGCSDSLDTLRAEVQRAKAAGFRGYKWRLTDPRNAGPFMKALREEAGSDFNLMVDLVQGSTPRPWPAATVFEVAAALEPSKPAFLEEPFPVEDLRAHRELRARVPYPIAGGEGISNLADAQNLLHDRPVDYLQPDATITGGITSCRQIGILAEAKQVRIAGHCWGAGVSMMANLHFALANPSSAMVETCWVPSPFREELYVEPLRMVNGCIQPPVVPGLGITLDKALLEHFAYTGKVGHRFDWQPADVYARQTTGD